MLVIPKLYEIDDEKIVTEDCRPRFHELHRERRAIFQLMAAFAHHFAEEQDCPIVVQSVLEVVDVHGGRASLRTRCGVPDLELHSDANRPQASKPGK